MMNLDWGVVPYGEAFERQLQCVEKRLRGDLPDTLIFVEHPPTYTLGRRPEAKEHLLLTSEVLAEKGIQTFETNRGGDITYHGPGQMVVYPIIDLKAHKDLHAYLRFLEEVLIQTLKSFGVSAHRNPGKTGIWIGSQKIAAIGIAVRQWIAYHGIALNVTNDLTPFEGIIPCGISPIEGTVTRLQDHVASPLSMDAVKKVFQDHFWKLFFY